MSETVGDFDLDFPGFFRWSSFKIKERFLGLGIFLGLQSADIFQIIGIIAVKTLHCPFSGSVFIPFHLPFFIPVPDLGNDAVRFFFHSSPGKYFKLPVALMAYGFIKPFYFRACNFENIITVRGTVTIFIGCPPGSADGSYIVFDNTGFDFMVGIQVGMP